MTDTGQFPGEGQPENAGALPGHPFPTDAVAPADPGAPAAYTFHDHVEGGEADGAEEDDLLLMPGAQGAWMEQPPVQGGTHETGGRDTASVDYGDVRTPAQAPPAAPRRPLHMGPPVPDPTGGVVRSLADRGPAAPHPAPGTPVQPPVTPVPGPEYLDTVQGAPEAPDVSAVPRLGEVPQQQPGTWDAQPQQAPMAPQAAVQAPVAEPVADHAAGYAADPAVAFVPPQAVPADRDTAQPIVAEDPAPQAAAPVTPEQVAVAAPVVETPHVAPVEPAPAADAVAEAVAAPAEAVQAQPAPAATEQLQAAAAPAPAPEAVPAVAQPVAAARPVAEAPVAAEPPAVVEAPVVIETPAVAETPDVPEAPAVEQPQAPAVVSAPAEAAQAAPAPVTDAMPQALPVTEAAPAEQPQAVTAPVADAPAQPTVAAEAPQAVAAPTAEPAPQAQPGGEEQAAPVVDVPAQETVIVTGAPVPPAAVAVPRAQPVDQQADMTRQQVATVPAEQAPEAEAQPVAVAPAETVAPAPVTPVEAPAAEAAQQPVVPVVTPEAATPAVETTAPEQLAEAVQADAPQQPAETAPAEAQPAVAASEPVAVQVPAATAPQEQPPAAPAEEAAPVTEAAVVEPVPAAEAPAAEQPAAEAEVAAPVEPQAADVPEQPAPAEVPAADAPSQEPLPEAVAPGTAPADTTQVETAPAAAPAPEQPEVPAATPATPAPQISDDLSQEQPPVAGTPVITPAESAPQPTPVDAAPVVEQRAPVETPATPEAPETAPVTEAPVEATAEQPTEAVVADEAPQVPQALEQTELTEPATPAAELTEPAEAAEPTGPAAVGYGDAERDAVHRVMRERRDIRKGFRRDPIPHEVLLRVLEAAHTAPSVGHSQPWDFVVIRSAETRQAMHELAARQRDAYAKSLPKGRAKQFKEMKIEAILDTPVNIVVTADPTRGGRHTLGRHTQPQMAPYSSALAVENLWLAARAEGLGVGWVSFFDEREMVRELGLPEHLEVVAYLCVGYVDEFPDEPELMQAGWSKRRPLSWVVHEEEYGRRALPGEEPHDLLSETLRGIRPLDAKALGEAWERQKRMTKPSGALGMLEIISAQLCGLSRKCPPPIPEPAAVAVFAGDHGVHAQGVTAWPQEVTSQMVANFLGGGAVCNAFAAQVGAEVCVVDVGVASELPSTPGLLPRKIRPGTSDITAGPAMTREEALRAVEVGIETARDLVAAGNKALLTGEMGIANTTVSAALVAVYTETDPAEITGRGTGINDEMHARKIDVVRRALELHQPDPKDPIGVLAAIGGLEHAALVGLILGGASLRTPVILDGVSAGAAALVARAIAPEALAACIAGHRSAEPGHVAALTKLGLRPLVDLDLRLGEGTGALLALPIVQSAARAMHEVATFDSAGVTEKG
ncbi:nicotinate-nucleotide--dimethylbenzimidazole phosphoribosyltransferase [Streptomyces albireticuli]|uniref:Nicotinate-nucleotide--dimethylbenzimidazole phosphoribosyltransferase n=1 Tax=Streptomyces albireticuli TaxID=1940 RepID=A0A1Z2LA05_9ACTN|nr:nicotinate-nucleotide--dimethylbenzimidazole phosphoribosyltransferase [Streptomyces albireticuli]ARZ71061.1 nicotinate-nucleotide--dimethylbenzimidazole phosphoribosyltransferase [Streptomyces albireticuli]